MAHNLNTNNGKVSFFSVKEKAWHDLGHVLDNCPTSEEAIKYAGLDFEVALGKIFVQYPNKLHETLGKGKQIQDKFATYRTDNGTPFGVVGKRYTVVQNKDAFSFFDAIVGEGEAIYETAGCLNNGEVVFITAKLPDYIRVGKDDIEKYLLFTMTHDGSGAIQAMFTPIRVVCNNTLSAALSSKVATRVSLRHTTNVHNKIKEAHKILGIANKLTEELTDVYNAMSKVKIDDNQFEEYMKLALDLPLVPSIDMPTVSKNILEKLKEYNVVGAGQLMEECKGTVYGAYQCVTGYLQNVKEYSSVENKFSNTFSTTAKATNDRALSYALDLIK